MKRRLVALVFAVVVVLAGASANVATAPPAVAAPASGGFISGGVQFLCDPTIVGVYSLASGDNVCKKAGDKTENKVKKEWKSVWNSLLGDLLKSCEGVVKWVLKKTLTFALLGPSLKLQDTGLFGQDATLAGMLVWLGWVVAAFGLMWQLGKMAVTGQVKYAGQAMVGWVQNALLTGAGLTVVAALLSLSDAMTRGLVNKTFGDEGAASKRIVAVMLPTLANPVAMLCIVATLLLVGGLQLVLIFLRQSAIPIQCLLLPIAGAGRVGGEATRKWAPALVTSIVAAIAYKPLLAVIVCAGFGEVGHSQGFTAWLRGLVTLILGVLAPGPLMKLFAPLGTQVGGGLSSAGALGAAASIGQYVGAHGSRGGGGESGGAGEADVEPATPLDQARRLEQTMPKSYQGAGGGGGGRGGAEALARVAATKASPRGQFGESPAPPGDASKGASPGAAAGAVPSPAAAGAGGAGAAAGAGLSLQVLDGVNSAVQGAAGQVAGEASE